MASARIVCDGCGLVLSAFLPPPPYRHYLPPHLSVSGSYANPEDPGLPPAAGLRHAGRLSSSPWRPSPGQPPVPRPAPARMRRVALSSGMFFFCPVLFRFVSFRFSVFFYTGSGFFGRRLDCSLPRFARRDGKKKNTKQNENEEKTSLGFEKTDGTAFLQSHATGGAAVVKGRPPNLIGSAPSRQNSSDGRAL